MPFVKFLMGSSTLRYFLNNKAGGPTNIIFIDPHARAGGGSFKRPESDKEPAIAV